MGYENEEINIVITNTSGQKVYEKIIEVTGDEYNERIGLNVAAGIYHMQINGTSASTKIMVID